MGKRRKIRKIAVFLLLFALSCAILFTLWESKSLTAEMAFRRMEKQNLIGPAEIVEVLDFEDNRYDHLLIGQSEYGYTFFEWNDTNWDQGILSYQPKGAGATLYCTEYNYQDIFTGQGWLPIFAFAEQIAASARLTLTTTQAAETLSYSLEAQRSKAGYFLFAWETAGVRARDFWLVQQLITGQYSEYILDGTATATLELYNAKGELVESYRFTK